MLSRLGLIEEAFASNVYINFNLNVKRGDLFKRITNHTMRAGGVLTIGSNRLQAIKLSKKVINNLKFRIR